MIAIVPAILSTTEEDYKRDLEKIWLSHQFDRSLVQIDLMDGKFVPNQSVNPEIVKKYPASFKYEIHLMVEDPYFWISELKDFTKIIRFIVPIEIPEERIDQSIEFIRAFTDAEIGFSINPETPISRVESYLDVAESLTIMSIHPGFQGQDFIPESVEKVKQASLLKVKNDKLVIEVDGGLGESNVKQVAQAGADNLVIGSHLLKGDIDENLEKIWEAIKD